MLDIGNLDSDVSLAASTAPQISEVGATDGSVLVVPVGSVEQHGNHLPVATDSLLATAVATAGAEAVADEIPVLVAPPVWTGFSPHHLSIGGTVTGSFDTLHDLLEDVAGSLMTNDFDTLLFLNGHGGNGALIDAAVSTVGQSHPEADVLGVTYFQLATAFVEEVRESDVGGMAHGGEFETSLMLHHYPNLVEDDRPATYFDEPYDYGDKDLLESGPLSVYRPFEEYSDSGAIGDTALASADKGATLHEKLADEVASLLVDAHE